MKKAKIKYQPMPNAVVRIPMFNYNTISSALDDESELFKALYSDIYGNAILFAAPDLYEQYKAYIMNKIKDPSKREKVEVSLIKYLSRMSTRCTPFGMFATCSAIDYRGNTEWAIGNTYSKFRLDSCALHDLTHVISSDTQIRERVRYKSNTSIYKIGEKFRYIFKKGDNLDLVELEPSSLLDAILSFSSDYRLLHEISEHILNFYDVNTEDLGSYLHLLIDNQILCSELNMHLIGVDHLQVLCKRLSSFPNKWKAVVESLNDDVGKLSLTNPPSQNAKVIKHIEATLSTQEIKTPANNLIQVDSFRDLTGSFPWHVEEQLHDGFRFLCKISNTYANNNLLTFKSRFSNRYDNQEIRMLEALDPDMGIGYTITKDTVDCDFMRKDIFPSWTGFPQIQITPVVKMLLKKLYDCPRHAHYIEITDEDVSQLTFDDSDLPITMYAMFNVTRSEKGNYHVSNLHFSGSSAANLMSRFAYGNNELLSLTKKIAEFECQKNKDKIIAEISYLPAAKVGNILRRVQFRDYEITCLGNSQLNNEFSIPIKDLLVSVVDDKVVLRSEKLGKEVIPRLTTAHNYNQEKLPPFYRFLCDLQQQAGRKSLFFSWFGLNQIFDHLPEVRFKDIVVSPESWRLDTDKHHISCWDENTIENLKKKYNFPDEIFIVSGDNKLYVNLSCPKSRLIFFNEIKKGKTITIERFAHGSTNATESNFPLPQNEFIVPFYRN